MSKKNTPKGKTLKSSFVIQDYDDVDPCMMTLIVRPGCTIDKARLFEEIKVRKLDVKYNRNGDAKKKILCGEGENQAGHGEMFSASFGNMLKGSIVQNIKKKGWCKKCRLYDTETFIVSQKNDKVKRPKIFTLNKIFMPVYNMEGEYLYTKICMECENCKTFTEPKDAKTLTVFPTQLGISFSIKNKDKHSNIHVMIFYKKETGENNIKLSGCSSYEDVKTIMDILFYDYIFPKNLYKTKDGKKPVIRIEGVLKNKKFILPFSVDREKLVEVLSRSENSDFVHNVTFEKTGHTSVKIELNGIKGLIEYCTIDYNKKKPMLEVKTEKITRDKKQDTMMAFTSSDANPTSSVFIHNCKDYYSGKYVYDRYVKIISENKKYIEEIFE